MKQTLVNLYRPVTNIVDRIPSLQSKMHEYGVRPSRLWKSVLDKQQILAEAELKGFLKGIDANPSETEMEGLATHLRTKMPSSINERLITSTYPLVELPQGRSRTVFAIGHSTLIQDERDKAKLLTEEYFEVESTDDNDLWPRGIDHFDTVWLIRAEGDYQAHNTRRLFRDQPSLLPGSLALDSVVLDFSIHDVTPV